MKHFIKKNVMGEPPHPQHFHPRILPELESLYAAIKPVLSSKRPFIFLGASSTGEGVSTIGWALSYYIATRENEECLFVDGDIRYPSIRANQEMPAHGLHEYLQGETEFRELPFPTELEYLAAIHGGHHREQFVKLAEEKVEQFVAESTRYYRAVVFNARPGFDKFNEQWAKHSDLVMLLASYRSTKREILQQTLRGFTRAGVEVSGLIFNKQEHPIPDFLYRRL